MIDDHEQPEWFNKIMRAEQPEWFNKIMRAEQLKSEPPVHIIDLLACPFCGQLPRLKAGKVKCVNNQCKVQPKTTAWYAKGYDSNAVNDWNERRQANVSSSPTAAYGSGGTGRNDGKI